MVGCVSGLCVCVRHTSSNFMPLMRLMLDWDFHSEAEKRRCVSPLLHQAPLTPHQGKC